MKEIAISDEIRAQFERLLSPLDYSGPCNFDYKRSDSGEMAVFEINPRFGGTLMKPENIAHLQQALSCIIQNAV
jgi:carbamoylphosphate synthase large subunit